MSIKLNNLYKYKITFILYNVLSFLNKVTFLEVNTNDIFKFEY